MSNIKDNFNQIKDLFSKRKWIQGSYFERADNGDLLGHCLYGAICHLGGRSENVHISFNKDCVNYLNSAIHNKTGNKYDTIVSFNDTPGRTKQEIINIIDDAIKLSEMDS